MIKDYQDINPNKLHDELIDAGIIPLLVTSKDGTTWITYSDGTDMDAAQAVVDAHDPTPIPQSPTDSEVLDNLITALVEKGVLY